MHVLWKFGAKHGQKAVSTTDLLKLFDNSDSGEDLDGETYEYSDELITEGVDECVANDSVVHNEWDK